MDRISAIQIERNRQTRDAWQRFSRHRGRVTDSLLEIVPRPGSRLCVLGAGNCNDLDLPRLLAAYPSVTLVDLDRDAVESGVRRQGLSLIGAGITALAPVDLCDLDPESAPIDALARSSESSGSAGAPIGHGAAAAESGFDVVLSACVLSQLIDGLRRKHGDGRGSSDSEVLAVRTAHLRQIAGELRPGGVGVLISDFVSGDTAPALVTAADEELPGLAVDLIRDGNFFTGTNPAAAARCLLTELPRATSVRLLDPPAFWRWDLGPRTYLVYRLRFCRL